MPLSKDQYEKAMGMKPGTMTDALYAKLTSLDDASSAPPGTPSATPPGAQSRDPKAYEGAAKLAMVDKSGTMAAADRKIEPGHVVIDGKRYRMTGDPTDLETFNANSGGKLDRPMPNGTPGTTMNEALHAEYGDGLLPRSEYLPAPPDVSKMTPPPPPVLPAAPLYASGMAVQPTPTAAPAGLVALSEDLKKKAKK